MSAPRRRWRGPMAAWMVSALLVAAGSGWTAEAAGAAPASPPALADARARQVFGALQRGDDSEWTMRDSRRLRLPGTSRERADLPAGTRLRLAAVHTVRERGTGHELMLWHGERPDGEADGGFLEQVAVLAVFRRGDPAPIDVAEVKTDRQTYFAHPAVKPLGPDDDLFEIVNHHANAGQPYAEHSLYHLRQGRLRRIAQVDLLGELSGCAKAFEQWLRWRTEPDADRPLPRIVAEVELVHAPADMTEDCHPRPRSRSERFQASFRWDPTGDRYRQEPGGTLDRLARWNDQRR